MRENKTLFGDMAGASTRTKERETRGIGKKKTRKDLNLQRKNERYVLPAGRKRQDTVAEVVNRRRGPPVSKAGPKKQTNRNHSCRAVEQLVRVSGVSTGSHVGGGWPKKGQGSGREKLKTSWKGEGDPSTSGGNRPRRKHGTGLAVDGLIKPNKA